ncbi:DNA-packaging protein [Sinomonas albida]|uniref:DNA-packaging protein n=1 Tax=Sinomonas albida TaxID=369942 RepID=UPI00301A1B75
MTWLAALRDAAQPQRPQWRDIARPEQLPPPGNWLVWAYIAGRGAGKTRSGAEWCIDFAQSVPGCRIALVGRTPADVRDVQIEGESGIIACSPDDFKPLYEPSKRRVTWPNGSMAIAYSAEVPSQLRGPQHHAAWADEVSSWTDAPKGDVVDTAWNNLMLGLRLKSPLGTRCFVSSTPKANQLTKQIMAKRTTVITRGSTYDNLANLSGSFRDQVLAAYEGTRIGRQELNGELLEDVEGALWTPQMVEACHMKLEDAMPDLERVVVAVDPSGGSGPNSDEQGIVVAGKGVDGVFYVLADRSCKLTPQGWASRAVAAYHEFSADRIVAEKNFGGDMVVSTIAAVNSSLRVTTVNASRGKVQRAEPVAALYEQGRVRHAKVFDVLEDQMTSWTPQAGGSPDRLDALVWALTDLSGGMGQGAAFIAAWRMDLERRGVEVPTQSRSWRDRIPRDANGETVGDRMRRVRAELKAAQEVRGGTPDRA